MTKAEQMEMNRKVKYMADVLLTCKENTNTYKRVGRLRTCSAEVYEDDLGYYLKSYNTFVACISKKNHNVVDALRYVYGYTSTSAQHISKFIKDYGGTGERLTWKEV